MSIKKFQKEIWEYYRNHRRHFAWRKTKNLYQILVSEIMLQQTQTSRVVGKYVEFLKQFPSFQVLAKTSVVDVLRVWQGLGYNRRALMLKKTAEIVRRKYDGKLPTDLEVLKTLPGIGPATAGAVCAFAFNKPVIFIETNIRRVYLHFFFSNFRRINDRQIRGIIEKTLDHRNPREWYYALMDYGAMLGQQERKANPNRRSAHYTKQSKFEGSNRQIRGALLRVLLEKPLLKPGELVRELGYEKKKILLNLQSLKREGLII